MTNLQTAPVAVRFVTPPLGKQKGGIENAVEGLRAALQEHEIEVIQGGSRGDAETLHHFHGLWDPSHSRLAAGLRKAGRPYVVSPHGMLEPWAFRHRRWKKLPYFWLVERSFLLGTKAIFVTSAMEAEHLSRVIRHPCVEILPLGCRDRRGPDHSAARVGLGWRQDERVILFLSRIDVKKGLDMLLHALELMRRDWTGWRLVIVGDGDPSYVASVKAMATDAAEHLPALEWAGSIWGDARWPYLQGADLFCLPTHSENFGIAVLEALHAGTPVLTTDQTPWRDHSAIDGMFICKPDVVSICDGLTIAMSRLERGWSARDRDALSIWTEAHFAWENLVVDYVAAYERAASR